MISSQVYKCCIAFLVIFSLTISFSYAQKNVTLNGVVKSAASGETLIGASIKVTGSETLSTSTNAYGFYSLNIPEGNYKIEVSYIGYSAAMKQVAIKGNLKEDFNLEEFNNLNEVVITSVRRNENVIKAQMG
jgi:hypothetical protein